MAEQQDERLSYEIERQISQMPGLNIHDFRVGVDRGRAVLHGIVTRASEKQAALAAAAQVTGILSVDDQIAIETDAGAPEQDGDGALQAASGTTSSG